MSRDFTTDPAVGDTFWIADNTLTVTGVHEDEVCYRMRENGRLKREQRCGREKWRTYCIAQQPRVIYLAPVAAAAAG